MSEFIDGLALSLRIRFGGQTHEIAGGDIKRLDLTLHSYGFTGRLEFNVHDDVRHGGFQRDLVYPDFISPALGEVELSLQAALVDTPDGVRDPVTLRGLVQERDLHEQEFELAEAMMLVRRYSITFLDPAALLWRQHHPCQLYAGKTFRDVLEANRGARIELEYDWSALSTRYDVLFCALDPHHGEASFYDFVMFFVDRNRGYFRYDYKRTAYLFSDTKDDQAELMPLFFGDVARARHQLPAVSRSQGRVLNSFTPNATTQPRPQPNAVDGIVRDTLLCTPFDKEMSQRGKELDSRLQLRDPELTVEFARLPAHPLFPGDRVDFTIETQWPAASWAVAQERFRVVASTVRAVALDDNPDIDHRAPSGTYRMEVTAQLELKDDQAPRLPPFVEPETPVYVEGTVVSTIGSGEERTHEPFKDPDTGMEIYKVQVPLFNQIVPASYKPGNLPGQMYFPLHRDQRVQLGMTWRRALIVGCVDWREDVRTRTEDQGNHMLLGKEGNKSATSLLSYYAASDEPRFKLARTNAARSGSATPDCQTIEMNEGLMSLTVGESQDGSPSYVTLPQDEEEV